MIRTDIEPQTPHKTRLVVGQRLIPEYKMRNRCENADKQFNGNKEVTLVLSITCSKQLGRHAKEFCPSPGGLGFCISFTKVYPFSIALICFKMKNVLVLLCSITEHVDLFVVWLNIILKCYSLLKNIYLNGEYYLWQRLSVKVKSSQHWILIRSCRIAH